MEFRKYERRIHSLLALQNALMPESKSKKLLMTEQQLREMSDNRVKHHSEIINNSEEVIKRTLNPEIFFKHLNLFFDYKSELFALAPYISKLGYLYPQCIYIVHDRQKFIKDFLVRYGEFFTEKTNNLTSADEICKLWQEFFDSLNRYSEEMILDNIHYYSNLYYVGIAKCRTYTPVQ